MTEVVRRNFAPIFSHLKLFSGIRALIVAPPCDDFSKLFRAGKCVSSPKIWCKRRQNRPRKADATFCWSNSLRYRHRRRATAWQTSKIIALCRFTPTCVVRFPPNFADKRKGKERNLQWQTRCSAQTTNVDSATLWSLHAGCRTLGVF